MTRCTRYAFALRAGRARRKLHPPTSIEAEPTSPPITPSPPRIDAARRRPRLERTAYLGTPRWTPSSSTSWTKSPWTERQVSFFRSRQRGAACPPLRRGGGGGLFGGGNAGGARKASGRGRSAVPCPSRGLVVNNLRTRRDASRHGSILAPPAFFWPPPPGAVD